MILVIDDDSAIRMSLGLMLKRAGYSVTTVDGPEAAIDIVRETAPELVIMDMNFSRATSGIEGLTLLRQVKVFQPQVPVILMTAWGSIPLAVEGIQAGAIDFITKPWNNQVLLQRVATAIELAAPHEAKAVDGSSTFDRSRIIGCSEGLMKVLETIERIAATDAPVLIMGENGTGKELIAEALHINSRRASRPFVKVNLGGISQSLFESEMFGHKRGAFTGATSDRTGRFEMADGGTIFLDEIGDLDMSCQVKLLRVLQEHTFEPLGDSRPRKVDMRVVCATNADLPAMVKAHTFREDLFYRINLITVTLPPLRERPDDIPLLARHFAEHAGGNKTGTPVEITKKAIEYLTRLPYPGNIRELRNIVERTRLVTPGPVLDVKDFEAQCCNAATAANHEPQLHNMTLDEIERHTIMQAMKKHNGNLTQVAATLGITRQSLYRRLEKYGIES